MSPKHEQLPVAGLNAAEADLRREPRRPAEGTVVIRLEQKQVTGRLVDVSSSGFRACHDCASLTTGSTVRFRHPAGSGQARVVWNRIAGDVVETGFFIIG